MYLLDWDLTQEGLGWFSKSGVVPGVVEVQLEHGITPWLGNGDVSRWTRRNAEAPAIGSNVSRFTLWNAAAAIIRERPVLGIGLDNFRLVYGSRLGFTRWDTNIRTNNLYLEILAGAGIVGLLSFAAMVVLSRWQWNAPSAAIAIFLVHGLVDVFLMTTPIYFGFWILMGLAQEKA